MAIGKIQDYLNPLKNYLIQSTAGMLGQNNIQAINARIQKLAKGIEPIKVKSAIQTQQDVSVRQQGSYQATASVQTLKNGNTLNVAAHYTANGTTNTQLASQLQQNQEVTVKQPGAKPTTTLTQLLQNRNVDSLSQFALDKQVNSTIVANVYQKVGGVRRETSITTDALQNLTRNTATNAVTDTTKTITQTDKKGTVIGESFNRTLVNQATQSATNQNSATQAQRDITQDVSTSKTNIGGFSVSKTNIDTQDVRSSQQAIETNTLTNYAATVTNLDKEGNIIKQSSSGRITDFDEARNITTQENINSQREILSAAKGQEKISLDTEKISAALTQSTGASASTVVTNLKGDGSVLSQQTYVTNTQSDLTRTSSTDINRIIKQDAGGVQGAGSLESEAVTQINTAIETTAPSGAVTERLINRTIEDQGSASWAGSIQLDKSESGSVYSLKNIDISKRAIADVTKEGANELKVTTNTDAAKMVNGIVEYKPAEQVTPVANVAGSGVGISFAAYTGIASGFKLDAGEVNFNFSFSSSQITEQEVQKTTGGKEISETVTRSGTMNDASLSGKLTSVINEDGSRLITINAAYQKDASKLVAGEGEFGAAQQEANVEIQGTILVSKEGNVKNVQSDFQLFKTQETSGEGNSINAVRSAMDISDPLRKSFFFDNGTMRFNLGFATLNFAVYA